MLYLFWTCRKRLCLHFLGELLDATINLYMICMWTSPWREGFGQWCQKMIMRRRLWKGTGLYKAVRNVESFWINRSCHGMSSSRFRDEGIMNCVLVCRSNTWLIWFIWFVNDIQSSSKVILLPRMVVGRYVNRPSSFLLFRNYMETNHVNHGTKSDM